MNVPYDMTEVRLLDLSQSFSMNSPSFAFYEGPTVKWVKRLAFEGVNAQLISSTNHIATHLDSPCHFYDPGSDIAGIPINDLMSECGGVPALTGDSADAAESVAPSAPQSTETQ